MLALALALLVPSAIERFRFMLRDKLNMLLRTQPPMYLDEEENFGKFLILVDFCLSA